MIHTTTPAAAAATTTTPEPVPEFLSKYPTKRVSACNLKGDERVELYKGDYPTRIWAIKHGPRVTRITYDVHMQRKSESKVSYQRFGTVTVIDELAIAAQAVVEQQDQRDLTPIDQRIYPGDILILNGGHEVEVMQANGLVWECEDIDGNARIVRFDTDRMETHISADRDATERSDAEQDIAAEMVRVIIKAAKEADRDVSTLMQDAREWRAARV